MNLVEVALLLATGGGFGAILGEVLRHKRAQRERRDTQAVNMRNIGLEEFKVFEAAWRNEMARLHTEIAELRTSVGVLSRELEKLGVDPLAVRRQFEQDRQQGDPEQ